MSAAGDFGAQGPTRRLFLAIAAAAACAAFAPREGAAVRPVVVYDATRFKVRPPQSLDAFHDVGLYRGPRGLPGPSSHEWVEGLEHFGDAGELADLFAERRVAIAIVDGAMLDALRSDGRILIGVA